MGILTSIRDWLSTLLDRRADELFDVDTKVHEELYAYIDRCFRVYTGKPDWQDDENHIGTVNFAETVCAEISRLATTNIAVTITGSERADWLNEQIETVTGWARKWCEIGCAAGTVILKPNGEGVELILPDRFRITDTNGDKVTGAVFIERKYDKERSEWYTRLEYHRIEDGIYRVSNRYFVGSSEHDSGRMVPVERTPWVDDALADDTTIEGADKLLFGIFRVPGANNRDVWSEMGLPVFSSAMRELFDLDVAYSRNSKEIFDSKRLTIIDADRLLPLGGGGSSINKDSLVSAAGFPDYIKAVEGTGSVDREVYHEIDPSLNTDKRLLGINSLLSQIGFKCGFSNGYFVFNEKTGMVTATQVEADDRRTLQLISDIRKAIIQCLDGVIYALDKFADAYGFAPRGAFEVAYDFQDLTINVEEDKARWWGYVLQNKVPFWYFLVRFEGYTEEDAKALEAAAQAKEPELSPEE